MTPETRRRVIRYGIALDLVILATGVGLLLPGHPYVLLCTFIGACALASWKGGWAGGGAAIAASLLAIFSSFWGAEIDASLLVAFVIGSVASVAAIRAAMMPRAPRVALPEPAVEPMLAPVVAFDRTTDEQRARYADLERLAAEETSWRKADGERRKRLDEERALADAEVRRRAAAEEDAERKRLEAEREELQRQLEAQRQESEETRRRLDEERARLQQALEAERLAAEETARRKVEEERRTLEAGRRAAEEAARKAEEERRALEAKLEAERLAAEETARRKVEEERKALEATLAAERAAAEETARKRIEEERAALEAKLAAEAERRAAEEAARKQLEDQLARERAAMAAPVAPKSAPVPVRKESLTQRITSWFRPAPRPIRTAPVSGMNLRTKKVVGNDTASRRKTAAHAAASPTATSSQRRSAARRPRLLLLEKRRGTADTIVPKLRTKGVEVEVVERWIDAIDEMFRFRPDAIFIDSELPDFEKVYRSISENNESLPIYLTGRSAFGFTAPAAVKYVSFVSRPYDADVLAEIAGKAMHNAGGLLAQQAAPRGGSHPRLSSASTSAAPVRAAAAPQPTVAAELVKPAASIPVSISYNVTCFNCRVIFDAVDADWCSCLTKERTLVCTNCLTCFCKAAPSYKEKFWVEAPPKLFERKTSEARRAGGLPPNPEPEEVARPLVLAVEDDEDIQSIVQRVCHNLGYGFIYALNGQDGLDLAHQYRPNLILSDAFMPKLDGREMCRMLKQEPGFADTKMIVMTGLYTDTKYRSEALKRFHVDDYLAKPVAITDLINLLQKHLEGINDLPQQEDLHERDRAAIDAELSDGVPLAELLADDDEPRLLAMRVEEEEPTPTVPAPPKRDGYEVCCYTCQQLFDATTAEWCSCVGRDNTLVCPHCQNCFCKAPSAYRERFWMDAPPSLFERKMIGSRRAIAVGANPIPDEVKRPLILLVEDDENVQLIVRTVVTSMGFGFIAAANGQEGLLMAHEYRPDLILSDAFMPKLDGREMCRLLKEDPATSPSKAIIMTGLYTDRKYRNEALDYFKVDDYVAKPLAVDDLIKLFKKHLPQEVHATM